MHADGDRLIVVESKRDSVAATVFQRGTPSTQVFTFRSEGSLVSSRLSEGKLYLVVSDTLDPNGQPAALTSSTPRARGVSCQQLMRPLTDDSDLRIVKVHGIDLHGASLVDNSTAVVGGGDLVYQSAAHLYVAKIGYRFGTPTKGLFCPCDAPFWHPYPLRARPSGWAFLGTGLAILGGRILGPLGLGEAGWTHGG